MVDLHVITFGPFSQQDLINAFYYAAAELQLSDSWALLHKAALNEETLAENRRALYQGAPVQNLPGLTNGEKNLVMRHLDDVLRTMPTPPIIAPTPSMPDQGARENLAPPADQQLAVPPVAENPQGAALANAWNRYGGFLSEQAGQLGIDPGLAVAVLMIESRGHAWGPDGRLIIRFENHIFADQLGAANRGTYDQFFLQDPALPWSDLRKHQWRPDPNQDWRPVHRDQASEWDALACARKLNEEAALNSISMGVYQMMGFNHAAMGYNTAAEMFRVFQDGERNQLDSLFRFIRIHNLQDAANHDLLAFARAYNGEGNADAYAAALRTWLAVYQAARTGARDGLARGVESRDRCGPYADTGRARNRGAKTAARNRPGTLRGLEQTHPGWL